MKTIDRVALAAVVVIAWVALPFNQRAAGTIYTGTYDSEAMNPAADDHKHADLAPTYSPISVSDSASVLGCSSSISLTASLSGIHATGSGTGASGSDVGPDDSYQGFAATGGALIQSFIPYSTTLSAGTHVTLQAPLSPSGAMNFHVVQNPGGGNVAMQFGPVVGYGVNTPQAFLDFPFVLDQTTDGTFADIETPGTLGLSIANSSNLPAPTLSGSSSHSVQNGLSTSLTVTGTVTVQLDVIIGQPFSYGAALSITGDGGVGGDGGGAPANSGGSISYDISLAAVPLILPGNVGLKSTLSGDANFDDVVNGLDIGLISGNWLHTGSNVPGDVNGDGTVNGLDISQISSNWLHTAGGGGGAAAAVPEPTTFALLFVGAGASLLIQRRQRR